jgi:hypothetical protein
MGTLYRTDGIESKECRYPLGAGAHLQDRGIFLRTLEPKRTLTDHRCRGGVAAHLIVLVDDVHSSVPFPRSPMSLTRAPQIDRCTVVVTVTTSGPCRDGANFQAKAAP